MTWPRLIWPRAIRSTTWACRRIFAGNVSMGYYEAGHMMYLNTPSRVALKADLAHFIQSSVPGK